VVPLFRRLRAPRTTRTGRLDQLRAHGRRSCVRTR
jgi:hypothetical protein